ncbi:MAG: DMT family protein [Pirellulaceae bacterium]
MFFHLGLLRSDLGEFEPPADNLRRNIDRTVLGLEHSGMNPYLVTVGLLICSNVFMTFAWYGHLKHLPTKAWLIAAVVSWGIAFFEYLLQVPANRTGATVMNLGQLKILQEIIALSVFVPFSIFYMKQTLTWDYLWASLCIAGAVYFIFRSS